MSFGLKGHQVWALVVLVAAGAWVATGEFASVGSEEAHASQPVHDTTAEVVTAKPLRTVGVITPVHRDHARELRISGVTGADKRAELAARASGVISNLGIAQGDTVVADQIVMTIEGPEIEAGVATAEATLAQRTQELIVAEKLFASGNTAELQLIKVRAEKAAAEAALSQAVAAADRLNLRAPFAGVIDSIDVELGEWVPVGTPIATLISLDPIVVHAEVSELGIGFVSVGDRANVRLVNGAVREGTVRHISREATAQTRTYPVEVAIANADHEVPAGMTAEVRLYTTPERAVIVPRSVITLSDAGEIGLRVVGPDNIARFAAVELIDDTTAGFVLKGVPEGARIIVAGQDLVRDGDSVTAVEAAVAAGN